MPGSSRLIGILGSLANLSNWHACDKAHVMAVEEFDHPREIRQRAGQAVDLVDDHHIDLARGDVGEQPLEGGPLLAGHQGC